MSPAKARNTKCANHPRRLAVASSSLIVQGYGARRVAVTGGQEAVCEECLQKLKRTKRAGAIVERYLAQRDPQPSTFTHEIVNAGIQA